VLVSKQANGKALEFVHRHERARRRDKPAKVDSHEQGTNFTTVLPFLFLGRMTTINILLMRNDWISTDSHLSGLLEKRDSASVFWAPLFFVVPFLNTAHKYQRGLSSIGALHRIALFLGYEGMFPTKSLQFLLMRILRVSPCISATIDPP
jgi:hypothetical protein